MNPKVPEPIRILMQHVFSNDQFNTALHDHEQIVKHLIENKSKVVIPTLIYHYFDGTTKIAPIVTDGVDFAKEKYKMMKTIGYIEGKKGSIIVAVFLLSEGWIKEYKKIEDFTKPVREEADKREVIVLTGMTVDFRMNGVIYETTRSEKDEFIIKDTRVTEYKEGKGVPEISGDLTAMFYLGMQKGLHHVPGGPDDPEMEKIIELGPDALQAKKMSGVN